jgi:beta-glucanase (GH16 family)
MIPLPSTLRSLSCFTAGVALLASSLVAQDSDLTLVWSDEFDTPGLPDASKWTYDVGGSGWGNNELQYYTEDRLENARIEDGVLIIEAIRETYQNREYTSARLVSTGEGSWLYGRFEIRAKLPSGRGTWPAIWMLPTDWAYGGWPRSGEIDIMEHVGYDMNKVHATIHTDDFNHMKGTQIGQSIMVDNVDTEFHVYAMEWRPNRIEAFVDGERYFTVDNNGTGVGAWPFDQRFHLLLNIAVGGNWGGAQGVDETIWPQRMEIDYVRVYELDDLEIEVPLHLLPGKIELEEYAAQSGVRTETTSDTGGGLNLAYLGDGDWAEYAVSAASQGSYYVDLRYASPNGTAGATLTGPDNLEVGTGTVAATGGWQNWETLTLGPITLPAGESTLRLTMNVPGDEDINFNWMELRAADDSVATWHGFPYYDESRVVAEGWLGWLEVSKDPWIWSYGLSAWIYVPAKNAEAAGGWIYLP